jgi:L-ascorbate 6-phosphate lactonase
MTIPALFLGQAGVRLGLSDCVAYIDPYLTDSVADTYGQHLRRLTPPPLRPDQVTDADWLLITHAHLDHCDPGTILPIMTASPHCRLMAPPDARELLVQWGVDRSRITPAEETWRPLSDSTRVHAVPAAHPTVVRDRSGEPQCVGYVIDHKGYRVFHAGDTSPSDELDQALADLRPISVALLPVNERNYYRDRANIIGNMSVREAFEFATEMGFERVVPIHWDLFGPNSVYREEIELLYRLARPRFELMLVPSSV